MLRDRDGRRREEEPHAQAWKPPEHTAPAERRRVGTAKRPPGRGARWHMGCSAPDMLRAGTYPEGSAHDQAALVRAMLARSVRAWRAFQVRYDRLVTRCIRRVAPRLGDEEVREIQATLLVQLCANDMGKLRTFDPRRGVRLGTWIGMIATHCAIDHLRTLRREPPRAAFEEAEGLLADAPNPHEALDRKERLATASAVVAELSEKDRELFTLYFDEGLEVEQIAQRMRVSVNTVYTKKHKIQRRIHARLADADGGEQLAA